MGDGEFQPIDLTCHLGMFAEDMVVPGVFVENDLAPEPIGAREQDDPLRRLRHGMSVSDCMISGTVSIRPIVTRLRKAPDVAIMPESGGLVSIELTWA